jgi:hypothetical protein
MNIGAKYRIFAILALAILLSGCIYEEQDQKCEGGAMTDGGYVSFVFRASVEGPATKGDDITTGTEDNVNREKVIDNVSLLLFSQGSSDSLSILKYMFTFSTTSSASDTDYENSDGKLTADGDAWKSPTRRVDPGKYRIFVIANNDESLLSPLTVGTSSYTDLKLALHNAPYILMNVMGKSDEGFSSESDRTAEVISFYSSDGITFPSGYANPEAPYVVRGIELIKPFAKLRVNISTIDESGNVYPKTVGCRIESISINNFVKETYILSGDFAATTPFDASTVTEEYDSDNFSFVLTSSSSYAYDSTGSINFSYFSEKFPVFNQVCYNAALDTAATFPEAGVDGELFNLYVGDTRISNPIFVESDYASDPMFEEYISTSMTLVISNPTTGISMTYLIPFTSPDSVTCPEYIDSTYISKFTKYALLRNCIYEVNIVFKALNVPIEFTVTQLDWDYVTEDLDA